MPSNPRLWLGREDSNLRMQVPKTCVLPLDDAPAIRIKKTTKRANAYRRCNPAAPGFVTCPLRLPCLLNSLCRDGPPSRRQGQASFPPSLHLLRVAEKAEDHRPASGHQAPRLHGQKLFFHLADLGKSADGGLFQIIMQNRQKSRQIPYKNFVPEKARFCLPLTGHRLRRPRPWKSGKEEPAGETRVGRNLRGLQFFSLSSAPRPAS